VYRLSVDCRPPACQPGTPAASRLRTPPTAAGQLHCLVGHLRLFAAHIEFAYGQEACSVPLKVLRGRPKYRAAAATTSLDRAEQFVRWIDNEETTVQAEVLPDSGGNGADGDTTAAKVDNREILAARAAPQLATTK